MRINKKIDQFTPWQTQQDVMAASGIMHEAVENKDSEQEITRQTNQVKNKEKPELFPKKRITSVYSILRLKTQKNIQQSEQRSVNRKRKQSSPTRSIKPMNTNLISIINTYQELNSQVNPQNQLKKPNTKRFLKQHSKLQKITRNFLSQTPQPQATVFDIKKLKQSLFEKKNSSLQTLIKARQQLQKMQQKRQSPILRTYSVQNIKLNAIEQKSKALESLTKLSGRQDSRNDLNSTISKMRQTTKSSELSEIRPRLKSCVNLDAKSHVIDRLYDKFY